MAEFIRKTEATFPGPWLLDRVALEALDEIIGEQLSRLQFHDEQQNEPNGLANGLPNKGSTITLTLASGNKIRVDSFREAVNDVGCQEHEITKIELKIYWGSIVGDLTVPTAKGLGLSLVTLPEASQEADELFVRLKGWAEQFRPDWIRRFRGVDPGVHWLLAWMLLVIFVMIGYMTGAISDSKPLLESIRELVTNGVKPEDHSRALELLLRQSIGDQEVRSLVRNPLWLGVIAGTLVTMASLLSFRARTAFELGKGGASVLRQRRYDNILRKTIPTFLIMGVLASIIGSFAFEYLRSK